MEVILAKSAGFCFGVKRAVDKVYEQLEAIDKSGTKKQIYTYGPIIHNEIVVQDLERRGVRVIESEEELEALTEGIVVIRSHGVPRRICEKIEELGLECVDATCPFVKRIHKIVEKESASGSQIVIIGNAGHPEVEGTVGQVDSDINVIEKPAQVWDLEVENPEKVAYVSQTTISYDDAKELIQELKKRFPLVAEPKKADICYATQNRQDAVKELARRVDLVLVVGSKSSSNSNRLREVAEGAGTKAYLLDDAGEINPDWFKGIERVGITAGASAPEILVDEIVEKLRTLGADEVETMAGQQEDVKFPLPKGLWKKDLENARENQK